MTATVWRRDGYEIDTDPARLDRAAIHGFLATSYWSPGVDRAVVERGIDNALPFGLYRSADGDQAGFARVITDRASFGYLADVFVLPAHRGRGLGKFLIETIVGHPELQGLRRFLLFTRDAHGLYAQHGFAPLPDPTRAMMRDRPQGSG